jgi:integrase
MRDGPGVKKRRRPRREFAGVYERPESSMLWGRYRDQHGVPQRESLETSDWDEAKRRLDLRRGEVASGKFRQDRPVSLKAGRDVYYGVRLRPAQPGETEPPVRSWRRQRELLDHPLSFFGLSRSVQSIGKPDLFAFIEARQRPTVRKFGKVERERIPTVAEVNRELSALRSFMNWSKGYFDAIESTVFDRLSRADRRLLFRNEPAAFYELTAEQLGRLLEVAPPYLRVFVEFLARTGMRHQEANGLDWEQVSLPPWGRFVTLRAADTKSKRDRVVHLDDAAVALLQSLPYRSEGGRVFRGAGGKPITSFQTAWVRACRKAGIPTGRGGCRVHDLRHFRVSAAVMAGVDPATVAEEVGHATLALTLSRYTHVSRVHRLDAVRRAGAAISERLGSTVRAQSVVSEEAARG